MSDSEEKPIFNKKRIASVSILALLVLSLYGSYLILKPYIHSFILAGIFVSIFYPLHTFYLKKLDRFKKKKTFAALLSTASIAGFVLVPLMVFVSILAYRAYDRFTAAKEWVEEGHLEKKLNEFKFIIPDKSEESEDESSTDSTITSPINTPSIQSTDDSTVAGVAESPIVLKSKTAQRLKAFQKKYMPTLTAAKAQDWLLSKSQMLVKKVSEGILPVVGGTINIIMNFVLMLVIMFFFFQDGKSIVKYLLSFNQMSKAYEKLLIDRLKSVAKSALLGTGMTSLAQGVLAMVAFAIVGVPWFFWGVMTAFASLIPVIGCAIIWIPCAIYLHVIGKTGMAIFLALWSIIVVGCADNFIRPYFMKEDSGMSSMIAFFSILGGMQLFGLLGVIYGPLICGVCAVLLYIFKLELATKEEETAS